MKNEPNIKITVGVDLIENLLSENEKQIIETDAQLFKLAREKGFLHGRDNRPALGEAIDPFISPIESGYKSLYRETCKRFENIAAVTNSGIEQCKSVVEQLTQTKREVEKKGHECSDAMKKCVTKYPWRLLPLVILGVLFLQTCETVYNGLSFQTLGHSLLTALVMAGGVTFGILLLLHRLQAVFSATKTLIFRIVISMSTTIFLTTVFYALGTYRGKYLADSGSEHEVNILFFILFNWVLVLGTGYLLNMLPTWAECTDKFKSYALNKERGKLQATAQELKQKINDVKNIQTALEEIQKSLPAKQHAYSNWIYSLMQKAKDEFKSENVAARNDGVSSFTWDNPDNNNTSQLQ